MTGPSARIIVGNPLQLSRQTHEDWIGLNPVPMIVDPPYHHPVLFCELDFCFVHRVTGHYLNRVEAVPERRFVADDEVFLQRRRALQHVETWLEGGRNSCHPSIGIT